MVNSNVVYRELIFKICMLTIVTKRNEKVTYNFCKTGETMKRIYKHVL